MPLSAALARTVSLTLAVMLAGAVTACSGTGLLQNRTQGHVISDDAIRQVRPGASRELVEIVLGTPQTRSTFGSEEAYYYVETRVTQTAFGLTTVQERTVLAVYFDTRGRVIDKAVYGLEDGRVIAIESRRTPSYGADQTFIGSLLASL